MTLNQTQEWQTLQRLAQTAPDMRALFAADSARADKFVVKLDDGFFADFSKQPLDEFILEALLKLAERQELPKWREAMFRGEAINQSEGRSVLHTALRGDEQSGFSVLPEIMAVRRQMASFADKVRSGTWRGATGQPIRTVVSIGIGGSYLGPELVTRALRTFHDGPEVRFIANVDPADAAIALRGLDPATTLFVVASKTFTTQETMANATAARHWLVAKLGDAAVKDHFVAASTNEKEVAAFGIDPANMFPFRDWVGGRYSLWSGIGLPIMLAIGPEQFDQLLAGARDMDNHFRTAPLARNIPVLMALAGIWNRNFLNRPALAVLPYSQDLALLPAHLQQLEMESNGKSVDRDGKPVDYLTCPVVFGQPGTNGQHAFHQQIHQGPEIIPCDFIVPLQPHPADEALAPGQHRLLVANAIAQAAALLQGRETEDGHRRFSGNRPSTMIVMERITPRNVGRLVALYENKVAAQGWVWGVNSFDQFGVELGKELAKTILSGAGSSLDASSRALLALLP